MAEEVAQGLAAPEGLARTLRAAAEVAPHQLLREVTPLGLDRWRVTLASPEAPQRRAQFTLAMAGPMRWQVVEAALP